MSGILVVWEKELKGYLLSPLAYVLIGVFLVLGGYFFSVGLLSTRVASMRGYFGNAATILVFIIPILTMRLFAEEDQRGTSELLYTLPLSIYQTVLGKYLAAVTVFLLALAATIPYPLILMMTSNPDVGPILTSYLGFFLLGSSFLAAGCLTSSLTKSQVVAAVSGYGLLLFIWILGWLSSAVPGTVGELASALSPLSHFEDFLKGILDSAHVVFYLTLIAAFLVLTMFNIERRAWA